MICAREGGRRDENDDEQRAYDDLLGREHGAEVGVADRALFLQQRRTESEIAEERHQH